jgi:hypothetical protein
MWAKRKKEEKIMNRRTGYFVWLYGEQYWHRTYGCAKKRSLDAQDWCNGEHNQIIRGSDGSEVKEEELTWLERGSC